MYPYISLLFCDTEIMYSDYYYVNGIQCMDIYIERATEDSLINVRIQMPFGIVTNSYGMDNDEINKWLNFTKNSYSAIRNFSELQKEIMRKVVKDNATSTKN